MENVQLKQNVQLHEIPWKALLAWQFAAWSTTSLFRCKSLVIKIFMPFRIMMQHQFPKNRHTLTGKAGVLSPNHEMALCGYFDTVMLKFSGWIRDPGSLIQSPTWSIWPSQCARMPCVEQKWDGSSRVTLPEKKIKRGCAEWLKMDIWLGNWPFSLFASAPNRNPGKVHWRFHYTGRTGPTCRDQWSVYHWSIPLPLLGYVQSGTVPWKLLIVDVPNCRPFRSISTIIFCFFPPRISTFQYCSEIFVLRTSVEFLHPPPQAPSHFVRESNLPIGCRCERSLTKTYDKARTCFERKETTIATYFSTSARASYYLLYIELLWYMSHIYTRLVKLRN